MATINNLGRNEYPKVTDLLHVWNEDLDIDQNITIDQLGNLLSLGTPRQVKTQTLVAGATYVVFTGIPTTGNFFVDIFTDADIEYTGVDTSVSGSLTVNFEAQLSDVNVYCKIEGV